MKKFTALLMGKGGKGKPDQPPPADKSLVDNSLVSLELMDVEMHTACVKGLKKALQYLEDNITPAHGKLIFQTSGLNTEVDQLIKLIEDDTISALDFSRIKSLHSLAYAIVKVLARHDALIPSDLYSELTSSNVDYESLLKAPRRQYLGLLNFIMGMLWRLVYEKKCNVSLDQVCKTMGTVLLRPMNEGMISFEDEDIFQTPEMQLRLTTFSGILRCFRVDPGASNSAQGVDHGVSSSQSINSGKSTSSGAASSSAQAPATTASIQDRSVKLMFLDLDNRPTEPQLMEVLSNYGEVSNIGFKAKFAVVLFAGLESALECALDNDGHGLGPDIKVKYLGKPELLDEHMKHLEETYHQSSTQSAAHVNPANLYSDDNAANNPKNVPYEHDHSPIKHEGDHAQGHLPTEISAIHPYAGRSMADAGDNNLSLNLSTDYRNNRHPLDGYSSSSSNGSQQQAQLVNNHRPATAPSHTDSSAVSNSSSSSGGNSNGGWKTAQRTTSRSESRGSNDDNQPLPRPHTAPSAGSASSESVASTPSNKRTKSNSSKTATGIAYAGDGNGSVRGTPSPTSAKKSRRQNSNDQKAGQSLYINTTSEQHDDGSSSENGVNYSTLVSPPSSNGSLKRQRQIKKIQVGISPTASQQNSPYFQDRVVLNTYAAAEDDISYLEEYASPTLARPSRRSEEAEDGDVLLSTRELPIGGGLMSQENNDSGKFSSNSSASSGNRRNSRAGSTTGGENSGTNSRRTSAGSLLHPEPSHTAHTADFHPHKNISTNNAPATDTEVDIVNYFAQKIAKSIDRTHHQHQDSAQAQVGLSKDYTSVKALFEVAEREYQDQITTLEAKCIVFQDKIHQQENWLIAIEHRWQAELLQKQIHVTTLETDNRQLREEIQGLKMEIQSKSARIVALESSAETMQRAVQMSKDRAQRDSLSVVLSQQQVISNMDENLEAIKSQNHRLQQEIESMTIKQHTLVAENMQWKSKVAEWELKWEKLQKEVQNKDNLLSQTISEAVKEEKTEAINNDDKKGKYFEGILVAAGKQSILDTESLIEDKEYRTMRAVSDHEIEEYMNQLPGRYHPVYSKDTVGIIRSDTRQPPLTILPPLSPSKPANTSAIAANSSRSRDASPPKYLKVKFDDKTDNMTYSERLLANMTKHYRAGYQQDPYYNQQDRHSRSPPKDRQQLRLDANTTSKTAHQQKQQYHPYHYSQPSRSATITAAHLLPTSTEVNLPARPSHTQSTVPPPHTPAAHHSSGNPNATVFSPQDNNTQLSPSALMASGTFPSSSSAAVQRPGTNNNRDFKTARASLDDPMTAIRNYLAEKQLASTRADLGDSMSGMRFYSHLRAQFEHIDINNQGNHNNNANHFSRVPSQPFTSNNARQSAQNSAATSVKDDELWKLYV